MQEFFKATVSFIPKELTYLIPILVFIFIIYKYIINNIGDILFSNSNLKKLKIMIILIYILAIISFTYELLNNFNKNIKSTIKITYNTNAISIICIKDNKTLELDCIIAITLFTIISFVTIYIAKNFVNAFNNEYNMDNQKKEKGFKTFCKYLILILFIQLTIMYFKRTYSFLILINILLLFACIIFKNEGMKLINDKKKLLINCTNNEMININFVYENKTFIYVNKCYNEKPRKLIKLPLSKYYVRDINEDLFDEIEKILVCNSIINSNNVDICIFFKDQLYGIIKNVKIKDKNNLKYEISINILNKIFGKNNMSEKNIQYLESKIV